MPRSTDEYLADAAALCKRLKVVWYSTDYRRDPKSGALAPIYMIYRRGMGLVSRTSSPAELVAYLRRQLPAELP